MHRPRRFLLVWLAALAWFAGWGVHARMALAQDAGVAQLCATREGHAPGGPNPANRLECASCVQALSAAVDSGNHGDAAFPGLAASERVATARPDQTERAWRFAAHAPRAPPVARLNERRTAGPRPCCPASPFSTFGSM